MWVRVFQKVDLLRNFYWPLFGTAVTLSLVGCLMLLSIQPVLPYPVLSRQLMWCGIGLILLLLVVRLGYRTFLDVSYFFYVASLILLVLVMWIGPVRYGAQRWIQIGPFALQPAEFAKLAVILTVANYLGTRSPRQSQLQKIGFTFFLVMVPLVLILKQPDLGSAVIFLPILFCLLFLWGASLKSLFGMVGLGLASLPFLWSILKEYQKRRLLVFLNLDMDPLGAGYTATQSKIAVGSGQLWGHGFMHGTQTKLRFLPEFHTDFIFCVLAEEWGWIGSVLLLLLYSVLLSYAFKIMEKTTELRARLLAGGIIAALTFHVFVNIGMTVGVMPVVGIPLPFLSYGGSSLVTFMTAAGLLISIHKERSIF